MMIVTTRILRTALALAALCAPPALAADQPPQPINPLEVVRQLYLFTDQQYPGNVSYEIWADGMVHLYVKLPKSEGLWGEGDTAEAALNDLLSKSKELSDKIMPQAQQTQGRVKSMVEAIQAMLHGGRSSQ